MTPAYITGPDRAPILPDGTIRFYREILTADGRELIGREYPNEGYCWFNLNRAALAAGFTQDDLIQAEEAARDRCYSDAEVPAAGVEAGAIPAPARVHRSCAYVKAIGDRGRAWKPDPITDQFRFIVRMAVACHAQGVPYDVAWDRHGAATRATITATGNIPTPKPLPKAPKLKLVSEWKPALWDAVYRLDAYHDAATKRMRPGFVVAHSCGLSLVHPSESGELGVTEHGGDEDIRQRWLITHTASGLGFGLTLNFKRAMDALVLAASFPVDWTQPADAIKSNPECKRAGNTVIATFGKGHDRDSAKRRLAELERAA
jgi:hypothetical protein